MQNTDLRSASFIWTSDQPWRDLTQELAAQTTTVVSLNGTSRVLCPTGGWQMRVPLPGAHQMRRDLQRLKLFEITFASACGAYVIGVGLSDWHATTPLLAVLRGEQHAWASTEEGRITVETLRGLSEPAGHPSQRCPLPYCRLPTTPGY